MIVGNGMVAHALRDTPGVIFHAAGIADSTCNDDEAYLRDEAAVRNSMATDRMLVYISTVCAPGRRYTEHKRCMERQVMARGNSLVIRLPVLGGLTPNDKTLLAVIHNAIHDDKPLEVWMRAWRTVLDVEDAATAIHWYTERGPRAQPVEIGTPWTYAVPDIVGCFERHMRKRAKKIKLDIGDVVTAAPCDAPVKWRGIDDIVRRYYA